MQLGSASLGHLSSEEANGWNKKVINNNMQHQQVIQNFLQKGQGGRGTFVKADEDVLYAKFPGFYRPYGQWYDSSNAGRTTPLAIRLEDGNLLVNGTGFSYPVRDYQNEILRTLENTKRKKFGVVPFSSIVAARNDGEVRDWDRAPIPTKELQKEVAIAVPSVGEQWKEVTEKDKHGKEQTKRVHTLSDSVVRVRDRHYLSAVDETGLGRGMYFFAELQTDRAPKTLRRSTS